MARTDMSATLHIPNADREDIRLLRAAVRQLRDRVRERMRCAAPEIIDTDEDQNERLTALEAGLDDLYKRWPRVTVVQHDKVEEPYSDLDESELNR